MIDLGRHSVLGITIDAVDYEAAVERIVTAAAAGQPLAATALAVHGVMTGVDDPEQRWRLNHLDLVCPDGQPVRWALRLLHGASLPDRVYGPNLTLAVCARAADEGLPIFLYGSEPAVLDRLSRNLVAAYPALQIAGVAPSRFRTLTPEEKPEVVARIKDSGARLAFVGLGCPRQEVFAYEFAPQVSMPLIAVGAAFPFHAGLLKQAPRVLQDRGLEWAFRLAMEPRRLWRRYLKLNPRYAAKVAQQLAGKTFDTTGVEPRNEVLWA